jgi:transposase-like protein
MKYSKIHQQQLVKLYSGGHNITNLCNKYNIPRSTLYHWIHQYGEVKASNRELITAQHLYLLEKRIQRLTIENEIWKKCDCTITSPLSQKLESIERLYEEYGVHACCRVLEVWRSTFYHYLFRRPGQTLIQKEDEMLNPVICNIFEESKGRLGAKKIRILLMAKGYTASTERISRLMKEMNLTCISQKKTIKYNFSEKRLYRNNKLNQQFEQSKPNRV